MNELQNMTTVGALQFLKTRVRFGYLAKRIGMNQTMFSLAIKGENKGAPFTLPKVRAMQLQDELTRLAQQLFATNIRHDNVYEWQQPLAYGGTALLQVKKLNTVIRVKNIITEHTGMNTNALHHVISATDYCRYGRFSEDELRSFNSAIHKLALQISEIKIVDID